MRESSDTHTDLTKISFSYPPHILGKPKRYLGKNRVTMRFLHLKGLEFKSLETLDVKWAFWLSGRKRTLATTE